METIAVIKSGAKQYKVKKNDELLIEKISDNKNKQIDFDDLLNGKKVSAQIVGSQKGPKISIFKFRNKTRSGKRKGHRQNYSVIKIIDIK